MTEQTTENIMLIPTNAEEAMRADSLAKRLGGKVAHVEFDPYESKWAVFGTFSAFPYSFHESEQDAITARDSLQSDAK